MPKFKQGEIELYYEVHGSGYPILLFAPGGMRSAIKFWRGSPFDPIETLSKHFQVITMDQRNAGASRAPISADDSWSTYTADHVALLDHLNIDRCHIMGGCIGGSYCFGLIQAAPDRVSAAVIQQTIGLDGNRHAFYEMFDGWADALDPKPGASVLEQFRSNMYDGEFLFTVDQAFVSECDTPLLVLLGNDLYHPESTSRDIVRLANNVELIEDWKREEVVDSTAQAVAHFLSSNTPG
jgi:pimeloyl-ACP methyl ester carboxylesterase